jgi:hypothetical protein
MLSALPRLSMMVAVVEPPCPSSPCLRVSVVQSSFLLLLGQHLNAGMDVIAEATVHVRTCAARGRLLVEGGDDRVLAIERGPLGGRIAVQSIPPWSVQVVLLEG